MANKMELPEIKEGPYVCVMTQVDPDAVASAFALKALLKQLGASKVIIAYAGYIGHPQNRTILNKFNLMNDMVLLPNTSIQGHLCLVDSHELNDTRETLSWDHAEIIIDHHRGEPAKSNYTLVEEVGACSTLLFELIALGSFYDLLDARLATLLALGIYTDTKGLVSATERDIQAYTKLQEYVDTETFCRLVNYSLPSAHFKHLNHALNHMQFNGDGRCIASVGFIDPDDGDDISSTADYLIRMDTLNLVIVWGIVDDSKVRISARSKDISLSLDSFLKRTFKSGGAKVSADGIGVGGATLELGIWACDSNRSEIASMVSKRLENLVFADGHREGSSRS